MILDRRTHPLWHVELRQKWQAQINPPGGRQDLTTDCAFEPSGREAPCDRGKFSSSCRHEGHSSRGIWPESPDVGPQGTPQCPLHYRSISHRHRDRCGIRRFGAQEVVSLGDDCESQFLARRTRHLHDL